jgi:regulatory protein NPR1
LQQERREEKRIEKSSMNLEEPPLKSLSEDFLSLLVNGQAFSDVTFAVEGRHVYAHKCVLAARSPFFRMIFCGDAHMLDAHGVSNQSQPSAPAATATATATGQQQVIPVGIVGYDVFMLLLQFLYSGHLSFLPQNCVSRVCKEKSCWHTHCSSAVEFGLETLNAAQFFGVDQLSTLTQKHLAAMAENASIEDVMRILVAARKQDGEHLWGICSKLVAKSGLPSDVLQKHLPAEVVVEIESIRQKTGYGYDGSVANAALTEQRTKRMQKALDSSDVELVNMMVMGEGLNLDKALALHYAVSKCSR